MVLLLLVIVQFALYFHVRAVASTAARHGLDDARVAQGSETDGVAVTNQFLDQTGRGLQGPRVTATRTETRTVVRVQGTVISVVPGLGLPIDVEVRAPTERFTP